MPGKLWAISDIHVSYKTNREEWAKLASRGPDDGLILAGDGDFFLGFSPLKNCQLGFGQDRSLLSDLLLKGLQSFLHALEIVADPYTPNSSRRDGETSFPKLIRGTGLPPGR